MKNSKTQLIDRNISEIREAINCVKLNIADSYIHLHDINCINTPNMESVYESLNEMHCIRDNMQELEVLQGQLDILERIRVEMMLEKQVETIG